SRTRARRHRGRASRRGCGEPPATAPPLPRSALPLDFCGLPVGCETAADDLHRGLLRACDLLVAVLEGAQHPARQDLLERAVEHEAREARVDVAAKLTLLLPANDDSLDRRERLVHLADPSLQIRSP